MREKTPARLTIEGVVGGGFSVAVVTHGDFSAAWQGAIGIGIFCGFVGLVYRAICKARGLPYPGAPEDGRDSRSPREKDVD